MPPRPRLAGALDALLSELEEVAAWEREIADEARTAAARRERLEASIRTTIGTLDLDERAPWLERLRETLGRPRPAPIPCQTERVRQALDWLARRDPPEFAVSDLAAHLRSLGHEFSRGYLPALLTRWTRAGVVEKLGFGLYRVNCERARPAAPNRPSQSEGRSAGPANGTDLTNSTSGGSLNAGVRIPKVK